jgi:uncharacterized protein YndB with AHSA1/START domain
MSELTHVLGRIERDGDDVAAVFDRPYATSPDDLWQACTDPERLARWFAPVTGDLRPGGAFTLHFDDADTPTCRVVTCEAPRLLVWEWPLGDVTTLVTVEVRPDGDGARLVLRHERLTGAQAAGYAAGWDTHLRSLGALLGGTPAPDWGETWSALHELYAGR